MTQSQEKDREELIEYLDTHCIDAYGELETWQVADFIIADRKRTVAPLVNRKKDILIPAHTLKAIRQTLKNAGCDQ